MTIRTDLPFYPLTNAGANSATKINADLLALHGLCTSGTAGYHAKFDTHKHLVNSSVYENSTCLGIGTASPIRSLHLYYPTVSCEFVIECGDGLANWKKWNFFVNGGTGAAQELSLRILNDAGTAGTVYAMHWRSDGDVIVYHGLHVGGASAPGDNNLVVDGSASIGTTATISGGTVRGANKTNLLNGSTTVLIGGFGVGAVLAVSGYLTGGAQFTFLLIFAVGAGINTVASIGATAGISFSVAANDVSIINNSGLTIESVNVNTFPS